MANLIMYRYVFRTERRNNMASLDQKTVNDKDKDKKMVDLSKQGEFDETTVFKFPQKGDGWHQGSATYSFVVDAQEYISVEQYLMISKAGLFPNEGNERLKNS